MPRAVGWMSLLASCALASCGGSDRVATSAGGASSAIAETASTQSTTHSAAITSGVGGAGVGGAASTGGAGGAAGSTSNASAGGTASDCDLLGVPGDCVDTSACSAIADHLSTAGLCPGPANIQCCTPYGAALCDPMVVPHPNDGLTTEAPGLGGCPAGMLPISTFCVDQFEASLVDASDGSSWSPYFNPGTTPMIAVSVKGAVPQGYIDGVQAGEACTNAGKRLCTDAEWLRACQGPSDTTYPYGDTLMLGVCNDHRSEHPAVEYFGTTDPSIYSMIDNPCLDQLPEGLEPAGSLPGCVTAEGAYDMMGNLHEWTADPAGTFRGGYFVDTKLNGPGCLYVTTAHDTLHWDYSTGFRCCADP